MESILIILVAAGYAESLVPRRCASCPLAGQLVRGRGHVQLFFVSPSFSPFPAIMFLVVPNFGQFCDLTPCIHTTCFTIHGDSDSFDGLY